MKKHISTIFLFLILIVGLSLLLYPTFSDWWNTMHTSHAIAGYDSVMAEMTEDEFGHLFDAATVYNENLRRINYPLMYYDQVEGYYDLLNIAGNGIMGYIDIPKIGVQLPIYHGTSEGVLQVAVGHVQGTSLPTGGENTHAVFSAHRGLPSARLFTDLDKMAIGDTFTVTVIDRIMTYEVDQILVVYPHEVEPLYVVDGEDHVTLVTCTPYGVNTHRILVRGVRIENPEEAKVIRVTADAALVDPILVAPVLAAPMLLLLLIVILIPKRKQKL